MFRMLHSIKGRSIQPKQLREKVPFVPFLTRRVQRFVELRGRDVEFIGIDSYNWAIFLVEFEEVKCVLAVERVDVVVKLVPRGWLMGCGGGWEPRSRVLPERQCRQFGPWK